MQVLADLDATAGRGLETGLDRTPMGPLGDFLILREVGRGGMGVVYEAEQISLGRRVALKVLPFASTLDPKQLQRFKNEAQAAAHLHHQNIVPVFATGCERSVHYYAMQFIEGHTLAEVIADLRSPNADLQRKKQDATQPGDICNSNPQSTICNLKSSTLPSTHGRAFYHAIARLGIQAAEALDYSHELGIIHRDIKPANMLVDGRGKLWITDFGLAHCQSQVGLTMSGDLVGTLRYMSPEQALAKRVLVDHRTDIYSLGATLHELLTGEPVFTGHDRQELLRQIAFEEPKPLRRHNKAIPAELETIVLKALEKNPADRYATAKDIAEDLERFVKDEPIRARRPSLARRVRNWGRKHRALAWSAGVVLMVSATVLAGATGWIAHDRTTRQTLIEQAVNKDLDEADIWQGQKRWTNVLQTLERAKARFSGSELPELQAKVDDRRRDAALIVQFEKAAALGMSDRGPGMRDVPGIDKTYRAAFAAYGLEVETLPQAEAVRRIRTSAIRDHLVKALDNWAFYLDHWGRNNREWTRSAEALRSVARLADDDEWRKQMREPRIIEDREALIRLAASDAVLVQPPEHVMILFHFLESLTRGVKTGSPYSSAPLGSQDPGVRMLLRVQKLHPADTWINVNLGYHLRAEPELAAEAVGYCRVAVALEPHNWAPYVTLGEALREQKRQGEAEDSFREAIKLQTNALGCLNFAEYLRTRDMPDLAESAILKAMIIKPDYADAYVAKGWLLQSQGKSRDAETAFRQAIKFDPSNDLAHFELADSFYYYHSNYLEAEAQYRRCSELFPGSRAYQMLGNAMLLQQKPSDAEKAYRKAIEYQPELAIAYSGVGNSLLKQGKPFESESYFRQAIDRAPGDADFYNGLGVAYRQQKKYRQVVSTFRELVKINPQFAYGHACLAALCVEINDPSILDAGEQAIMRDQALRFLQADLADQKKSLEKNAGKPILHLAQRMQHWLADDDLSAVRGEEALAKLPDAEAREWRKLWEDVAELGRQARPAEPR
jgi:serine/threonine protein kinase/Tfp pilus assembly protein PilF